MPTAILADGRQSPAALAIARGVARLMAAHGRAVIAETPLPSGRRADLVAIAADGELWIIEIKSSVEDFRADGKWPEYRLHCDRLFFAVPPDFPAELIPQEVGLVVADGFGGEIVRHAPAHPIAPATRKQITIRLARLAARRWSALLDPEGGLMFEA